MITLSIVPSDPKLVELIGALNSIGSGVGFRNTERSLSAISGAVARAWQTQVGSDRRISKKKLTPFSHEVYSKDKMVHWLEKGLKPFDMKLTHPFGKKSRRVKPRMVNGKMIEQWQGKRKDGSKYTIHAGDEYLIVPFRHGIGQKATKRQIEKGRTKELADVYPEVKKAMGGDFKRSFVKESPAESGKQSPNAWDKMIDRATYSWGSRMEFPETEKFRNLQGMVAMGPAKDSSFMTFRVVSVNSPEGSWLHPGIKARHYLENIVKNGQNKIQEVIEQALSRDLGYSDDNSL